MKRLLIYYCIVSSAALYSQIEISDKFIFRAHTFNGTTLPYRLFIPENNVTHVYNVIPYDGRDTTVGVERTPGIPTEFNLSQNYPNPFNPATSIEFAVPTQSMVELEVYNLFGERIAIIVDEQKQAVSYEVNFEGKNLPSGMYLYTLSVNGERIQTRKMLLVK
jgi:hypothetical protein